MLENLQSYKLYECSRIFERTVRNQLIAYELFINNGHQQCRKQTIYFNFNGSSFDDDYSGDGVGGAVCQGGAGPELASIWEACISNIASSGFAIGMDCKFEYGASAASTIGGAS